MFVLKTREKHILPKSVLQDIFNSVRFLVSYIHEASMQAPLNERDEDPNNFQENNV